MTPSTRKKARCGRCEKPANGGWTQCPEDGLFRELLFEAENGFYVDALTIPRYVLTPERADGLIICGECEDSHIAA